MKKDLESIETRAKSQLFDQFQKNNENSNDKKEKLLKDNEILDEMKDTVTDVKKKHIEINKDMTAGLGELDNQEKTIYRINDLANETDDKLTLHQQILGVMNNRELCIKLKKILLVLMLLVGIFLLVRIKFKK